MAARSLAARATLAVVLMIGFYLLALVVAAVLVFLPYAEARWAHRIHFQLAFFCLVGAGIVLWSAIPKRDKFTAPGPLLARAHQPRLFEMIDKISNETRQAKPEEVYLIHDVNAWVSQRGGFPGFGGRRVMGIGLPVLQTLTVSEMEAVLAHEFGHYHGGDTRLGVFVYQTRAGIERTIQGLTSADGRMSIVSKPFIAYGNFFLRMTQEVSRAQELAADALAARIVGARALIEGLKKIRLSALAYGPYLNTEFSPAIDLGFLPPIGEGFQRFMSSPDIQRQIDERFGDIVEFSKKQEAERDPEAALYDSHPPLTQRIAALESLGLPDAATDDRLAIALLDDVPAIDAELSRAILVPKALERSKPARWDEVGPGYLKMYGESLKPYASAFAGVAIEEFASRRDAIEQDMTALQKKDSLPGWNSTPEERKPHFRWLMGCALAVAAGGRGFTPHTMPGWPVLLRGPKGDLDPFSSVQQVADGEMTDEAWRARCAGLGLEGVPLS